MAILISISYCMIWFYFFPLLISYKTITCTCTNNWHHIWDGHGSMNVFGQQHLLNVVYSANLTITCLQWNLRKSNEPIHQLIVFLFLLTSFRKYLLKE